VGDRVLDPGGGGGNRLESDWVREKGGGLFWIYIQHGWAVEEDEEVAKRPDPSDGRRRRTVAAPSRACGLQRRRGWCSRRRQWRRWRQRSLDELEALGTVQLRTRGKSLGVVPVGDESKPEVWRQALQAARAAVQQAAAVAATAAAATHASATSATAAAITAAEELRKRGRVDSV
jgi:hypothetical protein